MKKFLYLLIPIISFSTLSVSCKKDIDFKDIELNFASTEAGMDSDENSATINIDLSRAATSNIEVTINVASDMTYGDSFTSNPALSDNQVKITIPSGSSKASLTISKVDGVYYEGTEAITFTIADISVKEGFVIGTKKESKLSFVGIVSDGETLTLEGKTAESAYANAVYVDFSTNAQTPVDRTSWNIGLYGGDEFRVILNGSYLTTATASTKNDINSVNIDDANAALNIAAPPMASEDYLSMTAVDSFDGSLQGTVFAAISATDSENKVYFVASETDKASKSDWYKVKINRKGEGYTVQYCKVGETSVKTIDVPKNSDYNMTFVSLENNEIVSAEPKAKKWDIMWSYNIGTAMGRPFFLQDYVVSNNLGEVQTAQVLTSDFTYEALTLANASSLTFSANKNVIASNWRSTGMGSGGGVKTDRFYVIKDLSGNQYKFRFTKMGLSNDGAERGRPVLEYALLK